MVENQIPVGGADEEETEPERQRLHRRDTPHHLKNKRINQQVSTLHTPRPNRAVGSIQ